MSDAPTVPMKGDGSLRAHAPSVPTEGREAAVVAITQKLRPLVNSVASEFSDAEREAFAKKYATDILAMIAATQQATGEGVYGAPHQPWCQPGDQPHRAFRLRFDDPDMREMVWIGPDAEAEALAAYNQYAPAWNVYLFSGHPRISTQQAVSPPEGVVEECKTCRGNGEIVTDWDRYLGPARPGDQGDEGTTDCPDCDGRGSIAPDAIGEEKGSLAGARTQPGSDGGGSSNEGGAACGGCGEADPAKRCLGCLHDFSAKGDR